MPLQAHALQQTGCVQEAEAILRQACAHIHALGDGQEAVVCGLRLMASQREAAATLRDRTLSLLHEGAAGAGQDPSGSLRYKLPIVVVTGLTTK